MFHVMSFINYYLFCSVFSVYEECGRVAGVVYPVQCQPAEGAVSTVHTDQPTGHHRGKVGLTLMFSSLL